MYSRVLGNLCDLVENMFFETYNSIVVMIVDEIREASKWVENSKDESYQIHYSLHNIYL